MTMRKRFIGALLILAVLLISIPPVFAAADDILYTLEAENSPGSNTGVRLDDSIVGIKGSTPDYLIYGTDWTIPAGEYELVYYMMLLDKRGDDSLAVAFSELYGNVDDQTTSSIVGRKDILEGSFAKTFTYYAVRVPYTVLNDMTKTQLRLQFHAVDGIRVDKVLLVKAGAQVPDPVQPPEGDLERPSGVEAHDSLELSLTPENTIFDSPYTGKAVDGRIEFRKSNHTRGKFKGMTDPFYLTSGMKTARIYLRTPDVTWGNYKFFTVNILQGGIPIVNQSFCGDDFKEYTNQSYVFEFSFQADENRAMNLIFDWQGCHDMIIDKVVFSDGSQASNQSIVREMPLYGSMTLDHADLEQVSSIDHFLIQSTNLTIELPAAYLIEWLQAGYTGVTFTLSEPQQELKKVLNQKAQLYDAEKTELVLTQLSVQLESPDGAVPLDELQNPINLIAKVPYSTIRGFGTGRKLSLCYISSDPDQVLLQKSELASNQQTVSVSTTSLGAIYIAAVDLSR